MTGQQETVERIDQERKSITNSKLDKADHKRVDEVIGNLEPDEEILWFSTGQQLKGKNKQGEDTIGVLVVTSRRLIYNGKLLFKRELESFPLERVESVSVTSGVALGGLTVTGAGFSFDLQRMNKRDATEAVERIRSAIGAHARTAESHPQTTAPSLPDQIRELARLRDEGLLTDEEFAMQKAKLLS